MAGGGPKDFGLRIIFAAAASMGLITLTWEEFYRMFSIKKWFSNKKNSKAKRNLWAYTKCRKRKRNNNTNRIFK
jgi:hypothetical protein